MNSCIAHKLNELHQRAQNAYEGSSYQSAIACLREAQDALELHHGRTAEWWHLRSKEAHNLRMQADYSAALVRALEVIAHVGQIAPRDRLMSEADVIACCIETQPLAQIERLTAEIYATDTGSREISGRETFNSEPSCASFKHYTHGLIAQRRGDAETAALKFARAWNIRKNELSPFYTRMVHLVKCAEMAYWCRDTNELIRWLEVMEVTPHDIPCDKVRLRYARLLALRVQPRTEASASAMCEIAAGALRLLEHRHERAHYWNYIVGFLYGLAAGGDIESAKIFSSLLPAHPKFERSLWEADLLWFTAASVSGGPLPDFEVTPRGWGPGGPDTALAATLDDKTVGLLVHRYRSAMDAGRAEDARLDCTWRQRVVGQRLTLLGVGAVSSDYTAAP